MDNEEMIIQLSIVYDLIARARTRVYKTDWDTAELLYNAQCILDKIKSELSNDK